MYPGFRVSLTLVKNRGARRVDVIVAFGPPLAPAATAKNLGLAAPPSLLTRVDEVIE